MGTFRRSRSAGIIGRSSETTAMLTQSVTAPPSAPVWGSPITTQLPCSIRSAGSVETRRTKGTAAGNSGPGMSLTSALEALTGVRRVRRCAIYKMMRLSSWWQFYRRNGARRPRQSMCTTQLLTDCARRCTLRRDAMCYVTDTKAVNSTKDLVPVHIQLQLEFMTRLC